MYYYHDNQNAKFPHPLSTVLKTQVAVGNKEFSLTEDP